MARHWSEVLSCSCGKTFRSYAAEARHRHNFPMLCKPAKKPKEGKDGGQGVRGLPAGDGGPGRP